MLAYLTYMGERLVEMRRLLKRTASLYLHCDPTASHYLKALSDSVFGTSNFRNEIIWRRTGSHNKSKRFGPIHDVILFYSRDDDFYFKRTFSPYLDGHVGSYFKKSDKRGRYWTNSLTGAGTRKGASGKPWRGYDPTAVGRHWAIPGAIIDDLSVATGLDSQEKLDAIDAAGFVDHPSSGSDAMPTYRQYLEDSPGFPIQDIWAYQPHTGGVLHGTAAAIDEDIRWLGKQRDSERLGYPTQKPLGLMRRIIEASCPADGIVLDPFCGCGTTVTAAEHLGRRWAGVDISPIAVDIIQDKRLKPLGIQADTYGIPYALNAAAKLAKEQPFDFERWAVTRIPGLAPNEQQRGDSGLDGRGTIFERPDDHDSRLVLAQVKGGGFKLTELRDFLHVMGRENAACGVFTTLDSNGSSNARAEVAAMGGISVNGQRFPRAQLWSISAHFDNRLPSLPMLADPYTGQPIQQTLLH